MTKPNDSINSIEYRKKDALGRNTVIAYTSGLTKREYFAAKVLGHLLSTYDGSSITSNAKYAVKAADALINELNKEK